MRWFALLLAAVLLAGCGGTGGGDETPTTTTSGGASVEKGGNITAPNPFGNRTTPTPTSTTPTATSPEPTTAEPSPTPEPTPDAEPAAEDVAIAGFAFSPATLEVPAGSAVTWTNSDSTTHTATADDGSFNTGNLPQGGSGTVTFDTPGTFAYHCAIHPGMTGSVTIM